MRQPSEKMVGELRRLRNIVLSCDQQFGDFVRYCMAECGATDEYILDVGTWTFILKSKLPSPKVTSIGGKMLPPKQEEKA